ncbi:MAG: damage-inducible protein DinB [Spirochaetaceae bacterium]|jgi:uncharacterized damage-inducible protein DinB|nr:damage-inducible protein DinB [Spirochaetaceae bacterium]
MNDALMFAKYNQAGNKAVYGILSKLDNEEREKDRRSYFGSLSALFRHVLGGTFFFLGMFKAALANNAAALKALAPLEGCSIPEGPLTADQWKALGAGSDAIDAAYVAAAEALTDADMALPVTVEWLGGKQVPLSFMLSQLVVHNTHHRGQISQILDSMKIDNDYSGIGAAFLSR